MPKEHGVWFMWLVPVALGTVLGRPGWVHLLVASGALLLHLASSATLEAVREGARGGWLRGWAAAFGVSAGAVLAYPVGRQPSLLALGALGFALFGANVASARARRERSLVSDALAIGGLQLWAPVSYAAGVGALDGTAARLWLFCSLYFLGTAFHVKTLFRQRADRRFKRISDGVHLALVVAPLLLGAPRLAAAYLPSALRTWLLPAGTRLRPIVAGMIEIGNSLLFTALMAGLW